MWQIFSISLCYLRAFWNFQNWIYTPFFSRAAKFFGSYTLKMAKVGLRMEVEIFQIQIFSEKISLFSATFFENCTFHHIFAANFWYYFPEVQKLNLYPPFCRAVKLLKFYTPKFTKVVLRVKVENFQIIIFYGKISIFRATFFQKLYFLAYF